MARKFLSTLLAILMVAGMLVPISAVFAESQTLLITAASDNGGTQPSSTARAAIPNLKKDGDIWYSSSLTGGRTAIATYRLAAFADVEGIRVAFYHADNRSYTFTVEYSEDGEGWDEVLGTTASATQSSYIEGSQAQHYEDGVHPLETFEFESPVYAKYLRILVTRCDEGTSPINFAAFHVFEAYGEYDSESAAEPADYSAVEAALNVVKDLTEDFYTEISWQNLTDLIENINYDQDVLHQDEVDGYALDIESAVEGLILADAEEIQIAQSFYSDLGGSPAWTNGSMIFTEPEYSLSEYKMKRSANDSSPMTIASWLRIFCAPTDDAVIDEESGMYDKYVITNIKGTLDSTQVPVSDDEMVPQNENLIDDDWGGYGFVLAINVNAHSYFEGNESQYASQEFGNRNKQAYENLALSVGDIVCLHGVINPFFETGDISAVDLDVTGTWIHRYGEFNGMGAPDPTPIYRVSPTVNENADVDGPQYLARDQFEDFFSSATLTRYVAPQTANPGDVTGDGEVTLEDLTMLAKAVAGWAMDPNAYFVENADCNGDGEVTLEDLTLLAKYVAGWSVVLGA